MNAAVAEYREAVEALALRISRSAGAIRVGAEFDDLAQEGLIQVWQSLGRGVTPAARIIELRMIDYIRWLGTQIGHGRVCTEENPDDCPKHVSYDTLLPLDDFRVAESR
jgi:DNA-directed RNA polymerase specialized sigma24 family protein